MLDAAADGGSLLPLQYHATPSDPHPTRPPTGSRAVSSRVEHPEGGERMSDKCRNCAGDGYNVFDPSEKHYPCRTCGGTGQVADGFYDAPPLASSVCPICQTDKPHIGHAPVFAPEPPMTRCPKCGATIGSVGGTCLPGCPNDGTWPTWRAAAPAPSLLDFEVAHRAGIAALTHKDGPTIAERAALNAQAAALVATARRQASRQGYADGCISGIETGTVRERARIAELLKAATDQYARMKAVAEASRDPTLMSIATFKWEALSDATGFIEALTKEARDDHR